MRRLLGIAGVLMLVLTACATGQPAATPGAAPPGPVPPSPTVTITHGERHGTSVDQPPPFRVRYGDTELHLNPFTYCYRTGCVDGFDNNPPSVGSPEELFVYVPLFPELSVEQIEDGDFCAGRSVTAEVTSLGDGWWSVRPRGPKGDYQISLFAGGGGGDMVAHVRWTTPDDRPLPKPSASLALIADHDGRPDSYGLELIVNNLPDSPTDASASITVTASNGRSTTIAATKSEECVGKGAIFFDGPDDEAKQAAALGDFPFTTTVELTLDGTTYVATATYPDDEIPGQEPYVALEFDPPLPQ